MNLRLFVFLVLTQKILISGEHSVGSSDDLPQMSLLREYKQWFEEFPEVGFPWFFGKFLE